MANIIETDNWPGGVYQYADGDVLEGGPDSSEVLPFKQLAQRSLYQRLRNVTDWDVGLAAGFGYPAGAVVRHAGVSWRSKVGDNDVEPGTDTVAWEKWGYSESELNERLAELLPYGAPVACPNSGPAGAADKSKVHKSALGEYWVWLGDAWKVVAAHHRFNTENPNFAPAASQNYYWASYTAHRPGRLSLVANFYTLSLPQNGRLGVSIFKNGTSVYVAATVSDFNQAGGPMDAGLSCSANVEAAQGDIYTARIVSHNVGCTGLASFSGGYLP